MYKLDELSVKIGRIECNQQRYMFCWAKSLKKVFDRGIQTLSYRYIKKKTGVWTVILVILEERSHFQTPFPRQSSVVRLILWQANVRPTWQSVNHAFREVFFLSFNEALTHLHTFERGPENFFFKMLQILIYKKIPLVEKVILDPSISSIIRLCSSIHTTFTCSSQPFIHILSFRSFITCLT